MRRLLALLGLLAAFVVPTPAVAAEPPAVPPTITVAAPAGPHARVAPLAVTVKIHHYNICGSIPDDVCTRDQADNAENLLHYLAVADGAWFISINEICANTFKRLTKALQSAGTMVMSKQYDTDCDGGFGEAIIHPGGVKVDGKAWYFPTQEEGKDCTDPAPETECRTGLCLKLATFAGPMAQCTAHLGAGDVDTDQGLKDTVTQSDEYAWIARSWVEQGRRMSLAGDFNLTPAQLHPAYDGLVNLVIGNTHDTREELDMKIDHIFIEPVGNWVYHSAFCTGAAAVASDHCYTNGDWQL